MKIFSVTPVTYNIHKTQSNDVRNNYVATKPMGYDSVSFSGKKKYDKIAENKQKMSNKLETLEVTCETLKRFVDQEYSEGMEEDLEKLQECKNIYKNNYLDLVYGELNQKKKKELTNYFKNSGINNTRLNQYLTTGFLKYLEQYGYNELKNLLEKYNYDPNNYNIKKNDGSIEISRIQYVLDTKHLIPIIEFSLQNKEYKTLIESVQKLESYKSGNRNISNIFNLTKEILDLQDKIEKQEKKFKEKSEKQEQKDQETLKNIRLEDKDNLRKELGKLISNPEDITFIETAIRRAQISPVLFSILNGLEINAQKRESKNREDIATLKQRQIEIQKTISSLTQTPYTRELTLEIIQDIQSEYENEQKQKNKSPDTPKLQTNTEEKIPLIDDKELQDEILEFFIRNDGKLPENNKGAFRAVNNVRIYLNNIDFTDNSYGLKELHRIFLQKYDKKMPLDNFCIYYNLWLEAKTINEASANNAEVEIIKNNNQTTKEYTNEPQIIQTNRLKYNFLIPEQEQEKIDMVLKDYYNGKMDDSAEKNLLDILTKNGKIKEPEIINYLFGKFYYSYNNDQNNIDKDTSAMFYKLPEILKNTQFGEDMKQTQSVLNKMEEYANLDDKTSIIKIRKIFANITNNKIEKEIFEEIIEPEYINCDTIFLDNNHNRTLTINKIAKQQIKQEVLTLKERTKLYDFFERAIQDGRYDNLGKEITRNTNLEGALELGQGIPADRIISSKSDKFNFIIFCKGGIHGSAKNKKDIITRISNQMEKLNNS